MECFQCGHVGLTNLNHKIGFLVCLVVGLMCLFGFGFLIFIPLCIDDLKDVEHLCSKCNTKIGILRAANPDGKPNPNVKPMS